MIIGGALAVFSGLSLITLLPEGPSAAGGMAEIILIIGIILFVKGYKSRRRKKNADTAGTSRDTT